MSCHSTAWCCQVYRVNWQKEGSFCPFLLLWNSARSWAWTLLNCWNFSWLAAVEQPWPRFVCVLGLCFVEESFGSAARGADYRDSKNRMWVVHSAGVLILLYTLNWKYKISWLVMVPPANEAALRVMTVELM